METISAKIVIEITGVILRIKYEILSFAQSQKPRKPFHNLFMFAKKLLFYSILIIASVLPVPKKNYLVARTG
jgi:hypothetical protein